MHRPFFEPLGLTFPQYLVILELLETSPGSVGKIGAKLGLDTGETTPFPSDHRGSSERRGLG